MPAINLYDYLITIVKKLEDCNDYDDVENTIKKMSTAERRLFKKNILDPALEMLEEIEKEEKIK